MRQGQASFDSLLPFPWMLETWGRRPVKTADAASRFHSWFMLELQLLPARVSVWVLWRHYARVPLHGGHHPALSGAGKRSAAGPHRPAHRGPRGAVQGTARARSRRQLRGDARAGERGAGSTTPTFRRISYERCARWTMPGSARWSWPYAKWDSAPARTTAF